MLALRLSATEEGAMTYPGIYMSLLRNQKVDASLWPFGGHCQHDQRGLTSSWMWMWARGGQKKSTTFKSGIIVTFSVLRGQVNYLKLLEAVG